MTFLKGYTKFVYPFFYDLSYIFVRIFFNLLSFWQFINNISKNKILDNLARV